MAFQFSVAARNAAGDAIETAIGTGPTLTIRTGTPPANCAAARAGTVLATLVLPSDWLLAASGGVKSKSGTTWQDLVADATGTAGHFSIDQGATCHLQGTVTLGGGGGDMTIDNTSIVAGQTVTVTGFDITVGGA
jgi:hypothetical protein